MIKVRVRNFQSIKDSTIKVDGLTVVTGANNSGKTALMRAIRGVFENSPFGSLLRKGEDKITVDIEFEDGQSVTWEKGPKDNSYIINGYKIAGVGRGAPEELKDLGIFPIVAATNVVWPQIASQFDGTIFLLNRSGAVLAEALSDVEKVGKLTSALRLSEKDNRSVGSELKVRRKDLNSQEELVAKFKDFHKVEEQVDALLEEKKRLLEQSREYERVKGLYERLEYCKEGLRAFDGFNPNVVPEKSKLERIHKATTLVRRLDQSYNKVITQVAKFADFQEIELPKEDLILDTITKIQKVRAYDKAYTTASLRVGSYRSFQEPILPKEQKVLQIISQKSSLETFANRRFRAETNLKEFRLQEETLIEKQGKVLSLVSELLGDLGECPVCKTPHGGSC